MFPELEISGGGTFAFIVTLSNKIKIYSISPLHGRMFVIPDLGVFQLDEKYRYTFKKSEVYFFDQKSCNPLDINAIFEIRQFLEVEQKNALDMEELQNFVLKFKVVEERKKKMAYAYESLKKDGASEIDLLKAVDDGTIEDLARKLISIDAKAGGNVIKANGTGLSEATIRWLNDYYSEDIVARTYLFSRILSEEKFRLRQSLPVFGFLPMNRTLGKANIGLIIVNNRVIELDPTIKVKIDVNTGMNNIETKQHGMFKVQETKTRYRYGKTNIYIMAVRTAAKVPTIIPEVQATN